MAVSISVGAQLTITTSSLPPAVFGSSYNTQLTAAGGTSPYRWTIVGGNLPPGLSLSQSGYITGTCTSSGEYTITVQVSDSTSPVAQTATRVLTVDGNTSLSITTGSLTNAQIQQTYSTTLTAAGGVPPYAWSLAAGSLPAGLTLAPSGTISGTPTTAGTATFSAQVADSSTNFATRSFTLTVPAPLTITTSTLQASVTGSAYITSLAATGGSAPYIWSITSGNLPTGLSLSATGIISGTPTTAGTATLTAQVADNSQPFPQTITKSLSISVTSPLTISITSLPAALTNTPYSQSLTAAGGNSPYTWSITSGQLPAGLILSSSGTISGTATTKGITNFVIQVTDSSSPTQSTTQSFILNVVAPLSITTSSLPNAQLSKTYTTSLAASGGQSPYTWAVTTGSLPAGLSLSTSGTISGTPTAAGLATFTVQATDSLNPGAQTATETLSINVTAPLSITTASLPSGIVGLAFSQTLTATGGSTPYTWSITAGQLPAGLTLTSGGTLSGTPTAAGPFSITLQVADSGSQTATQAYTVTIIGGLSITTTTLPNGSLNEPYNASVTATGGLSPYTWTISSGTLPPGLTLGTGGTITGTPTAAGAALFTLQAADSASPTPETVTQSYTIQINAPLTITTASLANGVTNVPYFQALDATGGTAPYNWSLLFGFLPAGITLDPSGTISGTPTTAGGATITVQVTDANTQGTETATQEYTINISAALTITTTTLPVGLQAVPYNAQTLAASNGAPPYTWSLASGQLPAGITLDPSGTIGGTPTVAGNFSFTVQATDSAQPPQTATQPLTITINASLTIVTTSLPNPKDGATYSQSFAAAGGTLPYVWSIASGSLPTGLVLTPDGTISGTAIGPGTFPFTVQVTDAKQPTAQSAQANFNLQTLVSFQITTTTIPIPK